MEGSSNTHQMGQMPHSQNEHKFFYWTKRELTIIAEHPEMTAKELHESLLPARSIKAIRRQRERQGRFSGAPVPWCRCCDERPVWVESKRARELGLCKGCYLDEMDRRDEEAPRANARRKRNHDARMRARRRNQKNNGQTSEE